MTSPLFSIVTISFNQGEFVARAIESVLTQRDARIEYIVCDPGSTDDSRAIIDSYGDAIAERRYLADRGPADGLNHGFARATGDIFAYLNSDDTYLPGAFARVARYFAAHPDVDVVIGHCLITDRHDSVLRRAWSERYGRRMVAHGIAAQFQPSTFIRAAAFRRIGGFNPTNRSSWDSELLVDLFLNGARIGVIDAFLSTYRLHAASITNRGAERADAVRFERERFERLMGRRWRAGDKVVHASLWLWKKLRHPGMALERLTRGPIQARGIGVDTGR